MTGTVKRIFCDRGFGFVAPDDGSKDLFFHAKDVLPAIEFGDTMTEMRVEFEVGEGRKGPCAKNVRAAT